MGLVMLDNCLERLCQIRMSSSTLEPLTNGKTATFIVKFRTENKKIFDYLF